MVPSLGSRTHAVVAARLILMAGIASASQYYATNQDGSAEPTDVGVAPSFLFVNSDGKERRPRANSPQESLYLFQSPSMALAISLAAERNQFDFLRPRSFKMPATWRLLPR